MKDYFSITQTQNFEPEPNLTFDPNLTTGQERQKMNFLLEK